MSVYLENRFLFLAWCNCHKHLTHTAPLLQPFFQYGAYIEKQYKHHIELVLLLAAFNMVLCQFPHSYLWITFCCFNHLVLRFKR